MIQWFKQRCWSIPIASAHHSSFVCLYSVLDRGRQVDPGRADGDGDRVGRDRADLAAGDGVGSTVPTWPLGVGSPTTVPVGIRVG